MKQKILVYDTFHGKKEDCLITKAILNEYDKLFEAREQDSLQSYLTMNGGKKMKGAEHIWKYRLNGGARILYTYGKYIPFIRATEAEAIVLLDYVTQHDEQGREAKALNLNEYHDCEEISELHELLHRILENPEEASDDDIEAASAMLRSDYETTISVYDEDKHADIENIDELEAYLTKEQYDCVEEFAVNPRPTLVMGGAGSGKTLVAEYILSRFSGAKIAYFTQSEALRKKAQEQFETITGNKSGEIYFLNINEYAMQKLDLNESGFVGFHEFEKLLSSADRKSLDKHKLTVRDLWTEIRGTVKGSLNEEWARTEPVDKEARELMEKGFLERVKDSPKHLRLKNNVQETAKRAEADLSLSQEAREQLLGLIRYFSSVDEKVPLIPRKEYENKKEEECTLQAEDRVFVYDISEKYQKSLVNKKLFDDNDLARKLLAKMSGTGERFDLVVIDEVQDYTEMQIKLAVELCSSKAVFMAGDEHQIINPTMFRESRLKQLFYNKKTEFGTNQQELNSKHLFINFRCPQGTVEFANAISEMRRQKVGLKNADGEQPEKSVRKGCKPFKLDYSETTLKKLMQALIRHARTAVLVATDKEKEDLIGLYGKEEYEAEGNSIIYTVPEIKGMEYKYVLCYDLFGTYKSRWDEILSSGHGKKQTRDRYYFNLVYVAATRTLETLTFMDSYWPSQLETGLVEDIGEYDEVRLKLDLLGETDADWIREGEELEGRGLYEQAMEKYKRGHAPKETIRNCIARSKSEERDFETAMKYFFLAGNSEEALKLAGSADTGSAIGRLILYLFGNNRITRPEQVTERIKTAFPDSREEEYSDAYEAAIAAIDKKLREVNLNDG